MNGLKVSYKAILATIMLCVVIYLYYRGGSIIQLTAIVLFLGVLYLWTQTVESFQDFQLKKEKWETNLLIGFGVGLAMFLIYLAYKRLDLSQIRFNPSILAAVAVVGAGEEFFFRGYLQGKLSRDFGIVQRIVVVTILFGLYKFSVFASMRTFLSLAEIIVISCVGSVILSVEMEKTQNLLAPVISHVFWDNLVYSNMEQVPSWISTTPQWAESLYRVIFGITGLFCSQESRLSFFLAGRQFVTCFGCTGIFLGAFFAFFLYEKKLFDKLHTRKFYIPALVPETAMFVVLNVLQMLGIVSPAFMSPLQLRVATSCYLIFGLIFGFAGAVLLLNVIRRQGTKWEDRVEKWLRDYEYVIIPALILAFLSNPLTSPQLAALIFFSVLMVVAIGTVIVFAILLLFSGFID